MQFVAPGVSKVVGVQAAMRQAAFDDACLAIRDDVSDLELIQRSRYVVAMGNARPEVPEAAEYVTAGNDDDDDDGAALVLEALLARLDP